MNNPVLKYWRPLIFLLLITPILTELLTNNISARKLFKPYTFLIFATLGYGPVLLLRELAVRWKLGFIGYILLGLVYGLYNEGLLAKTIFQTQIPNPVFNNYGIIYGINFSWAAIIIIFHAFYAFLFPIIVVNYFFPSGSQKTWLDKRVWLIISAGFFIYISYTFLKYMQPPVKFWHYIFLVVVMICLTAMAKRFRSHEMFGTQATKHWPSFFYGFGFVVSLFTIADIIVRSQVNPLVFILYMLAVLLGALILLRKKDEKFLLLFCLSAELTFVACCLLVAQISGSRTGMESSVFFILIFSLFLLFIILRKNKKAYRKDLSAN